MQSTAARELRFAVAMNGGVSLAVWIGGVAHELDRFARKLGPWGTVVGDIDVVIDVFAGTSAGGINAAFLAVAQRYGVDLGDLRELWMDKAGLEPPQGADATTRHLLREPKSGTQSLLDGEHFRDQLEQAFLALLPAGVGASRASHGPPDRPRHRLDLRLTTTAFRGTARPLEDQLNGELGEREHRATFYFVDESPELVGETRQDLTVVDDRGRATLARELARASRSTASFPFAFEPSLCAPKEAAHLVPEEARGDHLLDGGILNNLPVDQALEAIFAMPASHPVSRWLVTVVPDPSVTTGTADARSPALMPSVKEIVAASVVGIPRNQTIGRFVEDVRKRNEHVEGRRKGREKLLDIELDALCAAAEALWPSYKASRPAQQDLTTIATWPDYLSWETTVLDRQVALLLQLHGRSGSVRPGLRNQIHMLRRRSDDGLPAASVKAGRLLVEITRSWRTGAVPKLLRKLQPSNGLQAVRTARETLIALEVVQGAFELVEPGTEQKVSLGLLTPQRVAPLDDHHERGSADVKLAGDELGHFGAFLKRSWRANDWMWGRLDASTFLFDLLDQHLAGFGQPAIPLEAKKRVQTAIVMDEAPRVCQAVRDDADAGAQSKHGRDLVRAAGVADGWGAAAAEPVGGAVDQQARWLTLRGNLLARASSGQPGPAVPADPPVPPDLPGPTGPTGESAPAVPDDDGDVVTDQGVTDEDVTAAGEFLKVCRIGEEHVVDELWTSLVARVGLRAAATSLTVVRAAKLPLRSFVDKALVPVRAVALIANRYAQALRPRRAESHGPAWAARIATEVLAAVALADLFGVELGVAGPFVWAAFSALLLSLLPFAPLTTLLTVAGIGLTGLAMAMQDRWLPDATPDWLVHWLPLDGRIGIPLILATLLVITFPAVDEVDRFLRRILRRGHRTIDAIEQRLRRVNPT